MSNRWGANSTSEKWPQVVPLSQWSEGDGEAIKDGFGLPWSLNYPSGGDYGFVGSKKEMLAHVKRLFKSIGTEEEFIDGKSGGSFEGQ